MTVFTKAADLRSYLDRHHGPSDSLGFVPTMGALHRGHAALLQASLTTCDLTVASVFVNPSQFNDRSDLENYPRTPGADERLLREVGCELLYRPEAEDVYPGDTLGQEAARFEFGKVATRLEGAHRPGHFAGVAGVVSRLLDIVQPDALFLGQKDYQQVVVIRRLIEFLGLDVRLHTVPTVREPDGLALSSRNRRLSPDERLIAGKINLQLAAIVTGLRAGWPARELERIARDTLAKLPSTETEYIEIVDGSTLEPYRDGTSVEEVVALAAVRVGEVRLIDNRIAFRGKP